MYSRRRLDVGGTAAGTSETHWDIIYENSTVQREVNRGVSGICLVQKADCDKMSEASKDRGRNGGFRCGVDKLCKHHKLIGLSA